MSSDPQVERCLGCIRELSGALSREISALAPEAWNAPTNCSPWLVRDLIAHVVSGGEGFRASVARALAGSAEPPAPEARELRQRELRDADPSIVAQALDAATDAFEALYADLDEAGLSAVGWHRRGNRPVRWFSYHRLAEVAFHGWDFQVSLGGAADFDDDVAALLLPTLLESNAPRTYAAGLSAERGSGERFLLAVADDPAARWLVTVGPERLEAVRGDAPAEVTIRGSAAALALLAYGRRSLPDLFQERALYLDGDAAVAFRFGSIFPRP